MAVDFDDLLAELLRHCAELIERFRATASVDSRIAFDERNQAALLFLLCRVALLGLSMLWRFAVALHVLSNVGISHRGKRVSMQFRADAGLDSVGAMFNSAALPVPMTTPVWAPSAFARLDRAADSTPNRLFFRLQVSSRLRCITLGPDCLARKTLRQHCRRQDCQRLRATDSAGKRLGFL